MIPEKTLEDVRPLAIKSSTTQELIAELKRRGLGVYNINMPFKYFPAVKHQEISMHKGKPVCRSSKCKKHRK